MTEDTPLSRKVARLVADNTFDGAALNLGASGQPETLSFLLNAIDDTMMLRDAVFAAGQSALTLRISGKRVLQLVDATEDLDVPDGLLGQPLKSENQEVLSQVAAVLRRFVAVPGELTLDRRVVESAGKTTGSGVGVQSLSVALETDLPSGVESQLEGFMGSIAPLTHAIVRDIDGMVEDVEGDQLKVAELRSLVDVYWNGVGNSAFAASKSSSSRILQIIDALGGDDEALLVHKADKNQYFAIISVTAIPQVAAAWSGSSLS